MRDSPYARRSFLQAARAVSLLTTPLAAAMAKQTPTRPNVVLIMAENISTDLSCYGCPAVKTPHIDKLASEGVRYTHAFTTNPTWGPSRAAMALGAYQIKTNAHHCFMNRERPIPEPYRVFTHYLREAGYYTVLRDLHKQGKLTREQSLMFARRKADEELYDLKNDPGEFHDLAQSPEHKEMLEAMRKRTDRWVEETNDAGQHREKREEMQENKWGRYDEVYGKDQ